MGIAIQGAVGQIGEKPVTVLPDFSFNSMCVINGFPIGASKDGISILNNEELNNENGIQSVFSLPYVDFNDNHLKKIRFLCVGILASGEVNFEIDFDNGNRVGNVSYIPRVSGLQIVRIPFDIGIDVNGECMMGYFVSIKISSFYKFSINSIEIVYISRPYNSGGY